MLQYLILLLVQNKGVSYTKHNLVADVIEVFFADAVTPTKEEVEKAVFDLAYSGMLIFSNDPEELVTITPAGLEKLLAYKPLVNIHRHMNRLIKDTEDEFAKVQRSIEELTEEVLQSCHTSREAESLLRTTLKNTLSVGWYFMDSLVIDFGPHVRRARFSISHHSNKPHTVNQPARRFGFDISVGVKPT